MKTILKNDFKNEIVKSKKQDEVLSLIERIKKNIPKGKYSGLLDILEPHEMPIKVPIAK